MQRKLEHEAALCSFVHFGQASLPVDYSARGTVRESSAFLYCFPQCPGT